MTTRQVLRQLARYESRNVTFQDPDGSWPIVWERAHGVHVWDADGRRYLDLTAAFGVAAAGHANPAVVRAGQRQMGRLLHAMGDVHPHALKAQLARELSRVTFERWTRPRPGSATRTGYTGKTLFCNSGFEAVEAALKTCHLVTGKPGVLAFERGYHGLGYGALMATERAHFRHPFRAQLGRWGHWAPFPDADPGEAAKPTLEVVERHLAGGRIGAVLVEPVQTRGGIRVAAPGFLSGLRRLCDRHQALLVADEIYTGFGRTGRWFAVEHSDVVPDLICLGKALTGGFPLSACVGRADWMDEAWPASDGEAIHTSTFLGHPVGCAMALAQIQELRRRRLPQRAQQLGTWLRRELESLAHEIQPWQARARGLGLLAGLELRTPSGQPATEQVIATTKALLGRGFLVLPEGDQAETIGLTPPLTIGRAELSRALAALSSVLR